MDENSVTETDVSLASVAIMAELNRQARATESIEPTDLSDAGDFTKVMVFDAIDIRSIALAALSAIGDEER